MYSRAGREQQWARKRDKGDERWEQVETLERALARLWRSFGELAASSALVSY